MSVDKDDDCAVQWYHTKPGLIWGEITSVIQWLMLSQRTRLILDKDTIRKQSEQCVLICYNHRVDLEHSIHSAQQCPTWLQLTWERHMIPGEPSTRVDVIRSWTVILFCGKRTFMKLILLVYRQNHKYQYYGFSVHGVLTHQGRYTYHCANTG